MSARISAFFVFLAVLFFGSALVGRLSARPQAAVHAPASAPAPAPAQTVEQEPPRLLPLEKNQLVV